MNQDNLSQLQHLMTKAAMAAGKAIMKVYEAPIISSNKSDGSPVTVADQRAEQIILNFLSETGIPVLAEESVAAGKIPKLGSRFFVVDPLDGTKEFIKKNDEFTVNIALVENGRPICGIVTAPALNKGFWGSKNGGASQFSIHNHKDGKMKPIHVRGKGQLDIVTSRSHGVRLPIELQAYLAESKERYVGSSLKFCLIAAEEARIYPRLSPTSEWDTAAGQAVLEAAGGAVLTLEGKPLTYGKVERNFINPSFIATDCKVLGQDILRQVKGNANPD